jgi:hypothetical protein
MAKKARKTQQPADSLDPTAALGSSPLYTGIGAKGIRVDQALGIHICLDCWTNCFEASAEPTRICIQEWSEARRVWKVVEVIGPLGQKVDQALRLDARNFPGRYDGERVLSVYKPSAKPGP